MKMRVTMVMLLLLIPLCAAESIDRERLQKLEEDLKAVTRQLLLSQMAAEQATGTSGQSGVKQVRIVNDGTKPYFSAHHSSISGVAGIHNHPNHIRTVGMGEFAAVLNKVEFRTRHNDYLLRMPDTKNTGYHKTEEIPFPDVPEEVSKLDTLVEQSQEMREWFYAFHTHNETHRPYKKYFKPVLCYLEGAWTDPNGNFTDFDSDRHFLDARDWEDMLNKIQHTSYTGQADPRENYAYMPRKIIDIVNGTTPVIVQWNYRILCHPLKTYVDPSDMRMIDDLAPRIASEKTYPAAHGQRPARFQLHHRNKWNKINYRYNYDVLDKIMSEIPGKDNYPGIVEDNFLGKKYDIITGKPLNAARYHRYCLTGWKGDRKMSRFFSDSNAFVAFNTQDNIPGMKLKLCYGKKQENCHLHHQKVSYAIPLEIIYMTPLLNWNPYDIEYKGDADSELGKTVLDGPDGVLNGTNSKNFYRTPERFFGWLDKTDADTTGGARKVLDRDGKVRWVRESGTFIRLPYLKNIGNVRLRYPILPVHSEGNPIWRELSALAEQVENSNKLKWLLRGNAEMNLS